MARKRRNKPHRFPIWALPSLLLAGGFLLAAELGYGETIEQAARRLGGNRTFLEAAMSAEMGMVDTSEKYEPGKVSEDTVKDTERLPDILLDGLLSCDTDGETAIMSESLFEPPKEVAQAAEEEKAPTQTADGAAIKELTITGQSGGYPGKDGVYIQNDSGLSFSLSDMLASPLKISKNKSSKKPTVFILHTHASEAYVDQHGGRSENPKHNVVHIGDVLAKELEKQGIGVVHCREIIDVPSYNQSYNRAMDIIEQQMEKTPSIKVVLDVHRDSMITDSGMEYKVVSEVNGRKCAQLMMVMGTNAGGLTHPDWPSNLNFAVNLQKSILQDYPTLMRPVNLRAQRFNEQATKGSMILECGTSANTMHEAETAVMVFADKLAKALGA